MTTITREEYEEIINKIKELEEKIDMVDFVRECGRKSMWDHFVELDRKVSHASDSMSLIGMGKHIERTNNELSEIAERIEIIEQSLKQ